jgi:hypothetical protein
VGSTLGPLQPWARSGPGPVTALKKTSSFLSVFVFQAMWSEEVLLVELVKSDRGLGFSILDYQVKTCQDFGWIL